MTENDPEKDTPSTPSHHQERHSVAESKGQPLTKEAEQYAKLAAEHPDRVRDEQSRVIELLRTKVKSESIDDRLTRRATASTALARSAHDDIDTVRHHVDTLIDELRTERIRELSAELTDLQAVSHTIIDNLVRTIGLVIVEEPELVPEIADIPVYLGSISTDLDTETLRITTKALFTGASDLQQPTAVVETLGELIGYSDPIVQAWGAGALGRLAEEHPDTVATVAENLRALLDRDDETVQHNTIEALAALVGERPDVVVPAAAPLRSFLDHTEDAIQHNAAGVLGRLAETHPDAVTPAIDELKDLCDHEDDAVQRIATGTLARLAQERPEAVADR